MRFDKMLDTAVSLPSAASAHICIYICMCCQPTLSSLQHVIMHNINLIRYATSPPQSVPSFADSLCLHTKTCCLLGSLHARRPPVYMWVCRVSMHKVSKQAHPTEPHGAMLMLSLLCYQPKPSGPPPPPPHCLLAPHQLLYHLGPCHLPSHQLLPCRPLQDSYLLRQTLIQDLPPHKIPTASMLPISQLLQQLLESVMPWRMEMPMRR